MASNLENSIEGSINYIGSNIRTLLGFYGMSQRDLAEKLGKNAQYISRLVKDNFNQISIKDLIKVADILNVNMEGLIRVDLNKIVGEALGPYLRKGYKDKTD